MAKPSHGPLAAQNWIFGGPSWPAQLVDSMPLWAILIGIWVGFRGPKFRQFLVIIFPQAQGYIYGLRLLAYDLMCLGYQFITFIKASGFVYLVDKSFHQFKRTSTGFRQNWQNITFFLKFLAKKHCFGNKCQSTTSKVEIGQLKKIMWYSSMVNLSTMQHNTRVYQA